MPATNLQELQDMLEAAGLVEFSGNSAQRLRQTRTVLAKILNTIDKTHKIDRFNQLDVRSYFNDDAIEQFANDYKRNLNGTRELYQQRGDWVARLQGQLEWDDKLNPNPGLRDMRVVDNIFGMNTALAMADRIDDMKTMREAFEREERAATASAIQQTYLASDTIPEVVVKATREKTAERRTEATISPIAPPPVVDVKAAQVKIHNDQLARLNATARRTTPPMTPPAQDATSTPTPAAPTGKKQARDTELEYITAEDEPTPTTQTTSRGINQAAPAANYRIPESIVTVGEPLRQPIIPATQVGTPASRIEKLLDNGRVIDAAAELSMLDDPTLKGLPETLLQRPATSMEQARVSLRSSPVTDAVETMAEYTTQIERLKQAGISPEMPVAAAAATITKAETPSIKTPRDLVPDPYSQSAATRGTGAPNIGPLGEPFITHVPEGVVVVKLKRESDGKEFYAGVHEKSGQVVRLDRETKAGQVLQDASLKAISGPEATVAATPERLYEAKQAGNNPRLFTLPGFTNLGEACDITEYFAKQKTAAKAPEASSLEPKEFSIEELRRAQGKYEKGQKRAATLQKLGNTLEGAAEGLTEVAKQRKGLFSNIFKKNHPEPHDTNQPTTAPQQPEAKPIKLHPIKEEDLSKLPENIQVYRLCDKEGKEQLIAWDPEKNAEYRAPTPGLLGRIEQKIEEKAEKRAQKIVNGLNQFGIKLETDAPKKGKTALSPESFTLENSGYQCEAVVGHHPTAAPPSPKVNAPAASKGAQKQ